MFASIHSISSSENSSFFCTTNSLRVSLRGHAPLRNSKNIQIFYDTLQYLEERQLPFFEIEIFFRESPESSFSENSRTEIILANTTTFQMAKQLLELGLNPLVLDMSNKSSPGGSVLEGSPAQEETLCRQSNLYLALKKSQAEGFYPIPEHAGILIKNVTFFRDDNYDFLDSSFQVDVFVSAAYDCNVAHIPDFENKLSGYDRPEAEEDYVNGTKTKMRIMLQAAKANGNDSLVLSAFGCGAFKNDPVQISTWYKEVLNEPEFQNAFKRVAFAIQDNGQGNLETFKNTFLSNFKP